MNIKEVNEILARNSAHVDRLQKMILNLHSVACIRFWYWRLGNFQSSSNLHEDIMEMDALTTAIVMSYGRLFATTERTTKLKNEVVPTSLESVHKNIIDLRNMKYAHHGNHDSIDAKVEIRFNGTSLEVAPNLELGIYFGAPKHWAPLFEWLDQYMYETISNHMSFLTKQTGIEWKIPLSEPPRWVV